MYVVLIDQTMHREDNPVRNPNGYFRSMVRKAERGSSTCTNPSSAFSSGTGDRVMSERRATGVFSVWAGLGVIGLGTESRSSCLHLSAIYRLSSSYLLSGFFIRF